MPQACYTIILRVDTLTMVKARIDISTRKITFYKDIEDEIHRLNYTETINHQDPKIRFLKKELPKFADARGLTTVIQHKIQRWKRMVSQGGLRGVKGCEMRRAEGKAWEGAGLVRLIRDCTKL